MTFPFISVLLHEEWCEGHMAEPEIIQLGFSLILDRNCPNQGSWWDFIEDAQIFFVSLCICMGYRVSKNELKVQPDSLVFLILIEI